MKKLLITGAAGGVASALRKLLGRNYALRLTDISEITDCGENEEFVKADLGDLDSLQTILADIDGIVHLGGFSVEGTWDQIMSANIQGTYNLFEAAYRTKVKRIVFASSNHAVGFYNRNKTIDHTMPFRPDTRYGVSKAFGESLSSLYADKYGAEIMSIRIGFMADAPRDIRNLAIWVSPRDLAQLITIGLEHPDIKHEVVFGMSDNSASWWDNSNAIRLGYKPQDRSADYAEQIRASCPVDTGDPLADSLHGGKFVSCEEGGDPTKSNN